MSQIPMTSVKSDAISAIGYDPATQELHIDWKSGSSSVHPDVPADKHAAFVASDSKGKFFHKAIREDHPGRAK